MTDTDTSTRCNDDLLYTVAAEIHRAAPPPHAWEQLDALAGNRLGPAPIRRRGVLAVAAASILVVGVASTMALVDRGDSADTPTASDQLPPVRADARTGSLVVEQPALIDGIDAIDVRNDPADWSDRALFPAETPEGYTLASVSLGTGGAFTDTGGVDTGDVFVRYLSLASTGAVDDPLIVIETVPAGVADFDSDVEPQTITTDAGAQWDVYVEHQPDGNVYAHAYIRTGRAGGTVSLTGLDSADDAFAQMETLITSMRLVRVDELPADVIDLNRLPVVATAEPGNAAAGFIGARRATNEWCVVVKTPSSESRGCGYRIDPTSTPAAFVELGWNDQGDVGLAGMTSADVASLEIDLSDGTTITVEPTFPADSPDGIGFWVTSHRLDGAIPQDGPIVATRALDADSALLGPVEGP